MPLPTGNLYDNHLIHGGFYRHIDDLSVPWLPSPIVLPRELPAFEETGSGSLDGSRSTHMTASPQTFTSSIVGERNSQAQTQTQPQPQAQTQTQTQTRTGTHGTDRNVLRSKSGGWLLRIIRKILRRRDRFHQAQIHRNTPPPQAQDRQWPLFKWNGPFPPTPPMQVVPLSEWKAWGYYVAPRAPPQLDLEAMFDSLRIPDPQDPYPTESFHPERWCRGQRLPSLPPRPSLWTPLTPGQPLPFPWETQLNPALTLLDTPTHTPTLEWNISRPNAAEFIMFNTGPNGNMSLLRKPDYLQPATWPWVTHMYLNGIAFSEEGEGWWTRDCKLPWPVTVQNREGNEGVLLDDLFYAIQINFATPVGRRDWEKWPEAVKERAKQAYRVRLSYPDEQTEMSRALLRADWLGVDVYLYGLRPSSFMDPGWTLLMGPKPP
ncbi:hypothetical protein VNI00_001985 [Paramarasmius palmivorus]|uniref:DUF6699 domain-containing protein n=1 Tax=Paramarasmius palmivorus TaxID=297713 RepID=A0AAW0E4Z5_9AGAR